MRLNLTKYPVGHFSIVKLKLLWISLNDLILVKIACMSPAFSCISIYTLHFTNHHQVNETKVCLKLFVLEHEDHILIFLSPMVQKWERTPLNRLFWSILKKSFLQPWLLKFFVRNRIGRSTIWYEVVFSGVDQDGLVSEPASLFHWWDDARWLNDRMHDLLVFLIWNQRRIHIYRC